MVAAALSRENVSWKCPRYLAEVESANQVLGATGSCST